MSNLSVKVLIGFVMLCLLALVANAQISTSSRHFIKVKATAYCLNGKNCPRGAYGGKTASGVLVGKGQIAVDPRVIPLGTVVYIESPPSIRGFYVATDTGSAIKGMRIDVWLPDKISAMRFGRQNAVLRVVKGAPPKRNRKYQASVVNYVRSMVISWRP